jgi:hypothetical protein
VELRKHVGLGSDVVLGNVGMDSGLQPFRQPHESLPVAHESHGIATLLGARVLLDDLRVQRRFGRLASAVHEPFFEHLLCDFAVVHGLAFAVPAQYILRGIREGEALLDAHRGGRRTRECLGGGSRDDDIAHDGGWRHGCWPLGLGIGRLRLASSNGRVQRERGLSGLNER